MIPKGWVEVNRAGRETVTCYLGCSGRPLGTNRTGDIAVGPAQSQGAQTRGPAEDAGRHYLSDAQRLPVEPPTPGVGRRRYHPSDLPALGGVCRVLEGIWAALIEECQELGGVNWEWQSADCAMGKARFGGAPLDATPPTGAKLEARRASWWTQLADL